MFSGRLHPDFNLFGLQLDDTKQKCLGQPLALFEPKPHLSNDFISEKFVKQIIMCL